MCKNGQFQVISINLYLYQSDTSYAYIQERDCERHWERECQCACFCIGLHECMRVSRQSENVQEIGYTCAQASERKAVVVCMLVCARICKMVLTVQVLLLREVVDDGVAWALQVGPGVAMLLQLLLSHDVLLQLLIETSTCPAVHTKTCMDYRSF